MSLSDVDCGEDDSPGVQAVEDEPTPLAMRFRAATAAARDATPPAAEDRRPELGPRCRRRLRRGAGPGVPESVAGEVMREKLNTDKVLLKVGVNKRKTLSFKAEKRSSV